MDNIRHIILVSQHLDKRSSDSIEDIVSDICGLQYDPNPTIHLNHYMNPVHISHITGIPTAEVKPFFARLEQEGKIEPVKVGKKSYYIHSSKKALLEESDRSAAEDSGEVRLISPMDILVRDQTWLKTFFDYAYTFEYFKKKGMKWPLSILVGNRFVGYFDCKMEWRTGNFIIKERNIFDSAFDGHRGIERAIQDLAAFHGAKDIVEKG